MTTTTPTHGSLFTGYGGLDLAIEEVFGARTVWNSDIEPGPRKVLAHRFPGVPNLGDITAVDWSKVEPVDIIAGGSPCQDISTAGRRAGMTDGTRSNLWVAMRDAIAALRPRYVIWENVRGALSTKAASAMESDPRLLGDHPNGQPVLRALGRVLGDLADLGYDAVWHGLHAGCKRHSVGTCRECAGAPHGRFRIFVVAANTRGQAWLQRTRLREGDTGRFGWGRPDHSTGETRPLVCPDCGHTAAAHRFYREYTGTAQQPDCICTRTPDQFALDLLPTPRATDGTKGGPNQRGSSGDLMLPSAVMQLLPTPTVRDYKGHNQRHDDTCLTGALLPTPSVADATGGHERRGGKRGDELLLKGHSHTHQAWGPYAAAIARWETIVGPAPAPTKPCRAGRPKLNPAFAEWMMGAPAGWITDTPGVTDNEALRMAGNGVVRQQVVAALRLMLNRMETHGAETRSPCPCPCQKRDQP